MKATTLLALIFGIGGLILIGAYTHWLVALGVFLTIWGNNISNNDMLKTEFNKVLKNLKRKD